MKRWTIGTTACPGFGVLAALFAVLIASAATTQAADPSKAAAPAPAKTAPATAAPTTERPLVDGEIRKVDKAAGMVTLKHGDIPHLDMMGMTMVFKVKDKAMLENVKVGDRVRFHAERQGGSFVVTSWIPAAAAS